MEENQNRYQNQISNSMTVLSRIHKKSQMIHKVSLNPVRRYMIRKALLGTALCLSMLSQTVSSSAKVTDEPQQSMQTEQTQVTQSGQQNDEPQAGSAVTFGQLNANEVFLKQSQARVCTLTASTMMIRRAAMLSGNPDWRQITEKSVRKSAWAEKTGLKWNFTAAGVSVTHKTLSSKTELIRLLDKHPEGVVIYNSRKPHAILVTDYTDGVFYCSDPANDKPDGRYPVAQASITIESASRCWYVKNPVNLTVDKGTLSQQFGQRVDNLIYTILDEDAKTAACTGRAFADAAVVVPDTVQIQGVEYQVVQISEGAFADADNLKEIVIGADLTDIGPRAFYQCTSLQKVTINAASLQKIGTDAFAKIHKKAKIFVVGNRIETFAALLSGTSVPVTATIGIGADSNLQIRSQKG
ncbi:MAG: leucine-rich repeat protein [Eubacterium sp.]|nr:leucine-rich repeat protein [Eubacterium sp.]